MPVPYRFTQEAGSVSIRYGGMFPASCLYTYIHKVKSGVRNSKKTSYALFYWKKKSTFAFVHA